MVRRGVAVRCRDTYLDWDQVAKRIKLVGISDAAVFHYKTYLDSLLFTTNAKMKRNLLRV